MQTRVGFQICALREQRPESGQNAQGFQFVGAQQIGREVERINFQVAVANVGMNRTGRQQINIALRQRRSRAVDVVQTAAATHRVKRHEIEMKMFAGRFAHFVKLAPQRQRQTLVTRFELRQTRSKDALSLDGRAEVFAKRRRGRGEIFKKGHQRFNETARQNA